MQIIKLSKPNCAPCANVSNYLNERGVGYTEFDIHERPELIEKYDLKGVPVVVLLDGEREVIRANYFNPIELDKLINVWRKENEEKNK